MANRAGRRFACAPLVAGNYTCRPSGGRLSLRLAGRFSRWTFRARRSFGARWAWRSNRTLRARRTSGTALAGRAGRASRPLRTSRPRWSRRPGRSCGTGRSAFALGSARARCTGWAGRAFLQLELGQVLLERCNAILQRLERARVDGRGRLRLRFPDSCRSLLVFLVLLRHSVSPLLIGMCGVSTLRRSVFTNTLNATLGQYGESVELVIGPAH